MLGGGDGLLWQLWGGGHLFSVDLLGGNQYAVRSGDWARDGEELHGELVRDEGPYDEQARGALEYGARELASA